MLKALMVGLSNPKIQRIIVYILITILVLYLLSQASEKGKRIWTKIRYGTQGDDVYAPITDLRKAELEKLSRETYELIYSYWSSFAPSEKDDKFTAINALNDSEFLYLVEHYEKFMSSNTLYKDVDWEIMVETDSDDKLLARLKRMNLN